MQRYSNRGGKSKFQDGTNLSDLNKMFSMESAFPLWKCPGVLS